MDHSKWWEILKQMGIPDYLTHLLRKQDTPIYYVQGKKQHLELEMEQQTDSN